MKKKILALVLGLMLAVAPLAACGEDLNSNPNKIRFWAYGDSEAKAAYSAMVDAYNDGQGKIDGVTVVASYKPESGYVSSIEQNATTRNGPDVFFAWDRYFKKWTAADITANLTEYAAADEAAGTLDLDGIWDSTVSRFRYDKELNMSGEDEDIYGLPIDTSPTAFYYNKTAMADRNITIISVAAEDMERWNNNEIADAYGTFKRDTDAASITVPAKGFFRDDANTRKTETGGSSWQQPANTTVLVFNDQIAMNWDEVEDLGFCMTKTKNTGVNVATDYGYYTEWWFNYGWSVGGDCVVDVSGNGSWLYSHGDQSANYIVNEGQTFTGAISGKVYQAGETLEFLDKLAVNAGQEITADNTGGYLVDGVALGSSGVALTNDTAIRDSVKEAAASGVLTQLPSIREAFTRFCRLAGMSGEDLNICPYPSSFGTVSSINYFTSGKVAMIVERGYQIPTVERYVGNAFEWSTAPLPVYKQYTDPSGALQSQYGSRANAYNTQVARRGKIAGHSESTALAVRERSTKKDACWKFIRWMVSEEAQEIKASHGFIPNQATKVSSFKTKLDPNSTKNLDSFVEAAEFETPGDWWYMVDKDWIDVWANPLNQQVRYGRLTLNEYFNTYIERGNTEVAKYGNWENGLEKVTSKVAQG